MSLHLLVQLLEDEPGCGTKPPRRPHPHADADLETAAVPSYATRAVIAAAHDAVRLHQLGNSMVGGALHDLLSEAAQKLFDECCGSVPLSELIALLHLHWPPPPPSPWQSFVENLVAQYAVYAVAEKDPKFEKPLGILKTLHELVQEGLRHRTTGGGGSGSGGPHLVHLPLPPVPGPHFDAREKVVSSGGAG